MNETFLHAALLKITRDLFDSGASCALVGGMAVSTRTEPRFTKDLDLAVAVTNDTEAEALVRFLKSRQYVIEAVVEIPQREAHSCASLRE